MLWWNACNNRAIERLGGSNMTSWATLIGVRVRAFSLGSAGAFVFAVSIAQTAAPRYLENSRDPVQSYLSEALLGFAFQKKCVIQSPQDEAKYEGYLNSANQMFLGYLLAKGLVAQRADAVSYAREMAVGAIRFAATQSCDESAKQRVYKGQQISKDFGTLIEPYLKQPQTKPS